MSTPRRPFSIHTATGNILGFLEGKGKEGVSGLVSERKGQTRKSSSRTLPLGSVVKVSVTCAE